MMIGSPRVGFVIRIGRDYWRGSGVEIATFSGFRKDAPLGEIPWNRHWNWSSTSLPRLLFRKFFWRGIVIVLPVGFMINGRWRTLL